MKGVTAVTANLRFYHGQACVLYSEFAVMPSLVELSN